MSLEEAFYILGIIVMSLSLIILIVATAAILVIRNKIVHIHQVIEDKLSFATNAATIIKRTIGRG